MYTVTNQKKFDSNVVDVNVDIETFINVEMKSFKGTVLIETVDNGTKNIAGEHGVRDYEDEFGFVIDSE